MNKLESKTKEIASSGLMIELDLTANHVLAMASFLAQIKADLAENSVTENFDILLSQLISALEFNFPGTHNILFPDIELVNRKYEEL
jgi:hypothetical protein